MTVSKFNNYFWIIAILVCSACSPKLPKYTSLTDAHTFITEPNYTLTKFGTHKYSCNIDGRFGIKKFSLSGILVLKQLKDQSVRAVFQNEMGFTFFDFQWDTNDSFSVIHITEKMNKPALIQTLKKDFEILLWKKEIQLNKKVNYVLNQDTIISFPIQKGHLIMKLDNNLISQRSVVNNNKVYISFITPKPVALYQLPDALSIIHHRARFSIALQTLKDE